MPTHGADRYKDSQTSMGLYLSRLSNKFGGRAKFISFRIVVAATISWRFIAHRPAICHAIIAAERAQSSR